MRAHEILVADDSPFEAERIREILDALGAVKVTLVEDGAAALRASKAVRFDLVLCDYEMPNMNGLQLVRLLRSTWSRLELPILMLTVRDDVQTKVLSLRQGANDYVTKPVQPEELLARVQGHLDLKRAVEHNLEARVQVLEARKLETIGRLAAGLAHDLNTPAQFTCDNVVFLQKVFGATSELLERVRERLAVDSASRPLAAEFSDFWRQRHLSYLLAEAPKALDESLRGVMRMAKTVRDLKEFAGVSGKTWGTANLNRAIENTVAVSQPLWSSVARVQLDLDPGLPEIECDVTALKQAMFNILLSLVEETQKLPSAPRMLALQVRSSARDDGVRIEFAGAGAALPREAALAITAPRLPDAEAGVTIQGSFSVAHFVVVTQHHGRISCEEVPDRGDTVVIELPAMRPRSAAPSAAAR